MDALLQDVRYGWRVLAKHRGVTAVCLVTLAIGIGVVTTFFSFVNSALFRPLPYEDGSDLVALSAVRPKGYSSFSRLALDALREIRQSATSFERVAAYAEGSSRLTLANQVIPLASTSVDAELMPLLRVQPQIGRLFTAQEIRERHAVALISDSLWRTYFDRQANVVGRSIRLDGAPVTVIGVMPPGFRFYERSEIWLPLRAEEITAAEPVDRFYSAIGRLRPGASLDRARTEVRLAGQRLGAAEPERHGGWSLVVRDDIFERGTRNWLPYAVMVVGAAVCVLLVACSNVANVLLARAVERRGEMAVRASLGASRARLLRQNLTESVLLAIAAGAMGTLLAIWGVDLVTSLVPTANFPSWVRLGIDVRVLAFTFALSLLTVVAFGLLPALEGTRLNLVAALKVGGDHAIAGGPMSRRGRVVIIAELALSVVLFVGAALLARSYDKMSAVDPGYQADRVLDVVAYLDPVRYARAAQQLDFNRALGDRVATLPGVERVALEGTFDAIRVSSSPANRPTPSNAPDDGRTTAASPPVTDAADRTGLYLVEDLTRRADRDLRPRTRLHVVSDDYIGVMGLPLVSGRGFAPSDAAGAPVVALVSERLAAGLWQGENAVGKRVQLGRPGTLVTVAGVVRDVRQASGGPAGLSVSPWPDLYLSDRQATSFRPHLLVRVTGTATSLGGGIIAAARALDADQYVAPIRTLAAANSQGLMIVSLIGTIIGAFAFCALVLAMIGIYGVISYGVAQRTREIGIRMALGAGAGDVVRLVVRGGARLTMIGVGIGLVAATGLTQILRRVLWGVTPLDLITYGGVAVVFGAVALGACYLPARRAARVEPLVALRHS